MVCVHVCVYVQLSAMYSHWPSVPAVLSLWTIQVERGEHHDACQPNMATWLSCACPQKHMLTDMFFNVSILDLYLDLMNNKCCSPNVLLMARL